MTSETMVETTLSARDARQAIKDAHLCAVVVRVQDNLNRRVLISKREARELLGGLDSDARVNVVLHKEQRTLYIGRVKQ